MYHVTCTYIGPIRILFYFVTPVAWYLQEEETSAESANPPASSRPEEQASSRCRTSSSPQSCPVPPGSVSPTADAVMDKYPQAVGQTNVEQDIGNLRLDDETEYPPLTVHNDWRMRGCVCLCLALRDRVFLNGLETQSCRKRPHVFVEKLLVTLQSEKSFSCFLKQNSIPLKLIFVFLCHCGFAFLWQIDWYWFHLSIYSSHCFLIHFTCACFFSHPFTTPFSFCMYCCKPSQT